MFFVYSIIVKTKNLKKKHIEFNVFLSNYIEITGKIVCSRGIKGFVFLSVVLLNKKMVLIL